MSNSKNTIQETITGHPFEKWMTLKEWSLFEINRNNPEISVTPNWCSLPYYSIILFSNCNNKPSSDYFQRCFNDFITLAFFISDSPEGFDFWNQIANRKEAVR